MKDFNVNPDLWYRDLFAYKSYGGHDNYNYDWLRDAPSEEFERYIVNGLEE
jgi:hypothetical protein